MNSMDNLFHKLSRLQFDYRQWKGSWENAIKNNEYQNKDKYKNKMENIKKELDEVKRKLRDALRFYEYAIKFMDMTDTNNLTIEREELEQLIKSMRSSGVNLKHVT